MRTVLLLLVAAALVPALATEPGSISGRVTDKEGGPIPGADIVATQEGVRLRTVTDSNGRYALASLPAGVYTVTAALTGFTTGKRENVRVVDGETTSGVDLALCIGALDEVSWVVPKSIDEVWQKADLVARVRIKATGPFQGECPEGKFEDTAEVVEVLKARDPKDAGAMVAFVQVSWCDEPTAYPVGQEMVVFLSRFQGRFWRTAGPFFVFAIRDGQVVTVYPSERSQGTTDSFLARLRTLKQKAPPR